MGEALSNIIEIYLSLSYLFFFVGIVGWGFHNFTYPKYINNITFFSYIISLSRSKNEFHAGRIGGRKPGLSEKNIAKAIIAFNLTESKPELPVKEIMERTGLTKSTYYRYIEFAKEYLKKHRDTGKLRRKSPTKRKEK